MEDFRELLAAIAKRPAMYVGTCSLRFVSAYLDGYNHALCEIGVAQTPLDGWRYWIESRFLISHPAWHWTRILEHSYGNDQAAIAALPELYHEFSARRKAIGVEGIDAERKQRLIAEHGKDWYEPLRTHTSSPTGDA